MVVAIDIYSLSATVIVNNANNGVGWGQKVLCFLSCARPMKKFQPVKEHAWGHGEGSTEAATANHRGEV